MKRTHLGRKKKVTGVRLLLLLANNTHTPTAQGYWPSESEETRREANGKLLFFPREITFSETMDDATTLDTDRPHQTFQLKPQKFNNFGTTTLPEYFQQNVHIWTSCSPIWIDFLSANSLPLQGNNIVLFGHKPRRVAGFFFFCSLFAEVTRQSAT